MYFWKGLSFSIGILAPYGELEGSVSRPKKKIPKKIPFLISTKKLSFDRISVYGTKITILLVYITDFFTLENGLWGKDPFYF